MRAMLVKGMRVDLSVEKIDSAGAENLRGTAQEGHASLSTASISADLIRNALPCERS